MSKPNKISTRAKLRLNYYHLRLQVSTFFDRFKREKPIQMKNGKNKSPTAEELTEETSFSEPFPSTRYHRVPITNSDIQSICPYPPIISEYHNRRNDNGNVIDEPRINFQPSSITLRLESSYTLQNKYGSREQIPNLHKNSQNNSGVRAISSDESLWERGNERRQTPRRKRRSSRTRRHALDYLDTASINGDQPQSGDEDKDEKYDEYPLERTLEMQKYPLKYIKKSPEEDHERSSCLEIPSSERSSHPSKEIVPYSPPETFTTPRRDQPYRPIIDTYSRYRELRSAAQPQPPVHLEFPESQPRLIIQPQPQIHRKPIDSREAQLRSILRKVPTVRREIEPQVLKYQKPNLFSFSKPEPTQEVSTIGEDQTNKSSKPTSNMGTPFLSLGAKFLSLANRKRPPSAYEIEPQFLKFGFKFKYQTEPARNSHIIQAAKKAEKKAEARAKNGGIDVFIEDEEEEPGSCLLMLAKFVPRWLKDDYQPEDNFTDTDQPDQFNNEARNNLTTLDWSRWRNSDTNASNTSNVNNWIQRYKNLPRLSQQNPSLFSSQKRGTGIDNRRGFEHHELRPQNYRVYGQTTAPSTNTDGGGRGSVPTLNENVYRPTSKFTAQFHNLLQKKGNNNLNLRSS